MRKKHSFDLLRWLMLAGLVVWSGSSVAQGTANRPESSSPESLTPGPLSETVRELREQVRELQTAVAEMRRETQQTRAETAELRRELGEVRTGSGPRNGVVEEAVARSPVVESGFPSGSAQDETQQDQKKTEHSASLEEEYQLLSGKVDDQYQTKVESASKYRVRLSGIVLLNLFSNQGTVENIDLPTLAYGTPPGASGGSFGATLRQSEIGFEVFGPYLAGARTRADLQLDLAGGFATVPNGVSAGLLRLRTGTMRLDWTNTSVIAGQDALFFSPNSPTSFASLAVPALSRAGNLWGWIPQIRVEHRVTLGEESSLMFQGGILDPLTGESPGFGNPNPPSLSYYRQAGPGEESRQPAYASRVAWTRNVFGQPLRVGVGEFYSRQDYGFSRTVDGWAAMGDMDLPLSRQFSLSGKIYRGKGVGGLYGGIGRSVLFSGPPTDPASAVRGLNSVGGWAQLKYRPASKLEFNGAFGLDNAYAADLEAFPYPHAYEDPNLARNQGSFVNMIYRPRSDLLFSAEYRRLKTFTVYNGASDAGQINLMMGVLF